MELLPPGNIGKRLLPSYIDELSETEPDRIVYSICRTNDPADGFQDISARSFARAVDRCARHIEKALGIAKDTPTLVYMGPQDLVYAVVVLACVKTGYVAMLNSPRNSFEAHMSLLEKKNCDTFLLPPNFSLPVLNQLMEDRPMKIVEIPGIQHWIDENIDVEPYPFNKSFEEARYEPFVTLHTSGSTGLPKPVTHTHQTVATPDAFTAISRVGYPPVYPATCRGKRVYTSFPMFHLGGILAGLESSFFCGYTVVLGPFPPSAEVANAVHVHGSVQQSIFAPLILTELVKNPEYFKNLERLEQVVLGGGPVPTEVGDLISSKTTFLSAIGSTECGLFPMQTTDKEDWAYHSVSPLAGVEYRHVSDDLYEQVVVRNLEHDVYQSVFGTFPELNEYSTKDLFSRHPTKDNLWIHRGRADDIIVYSTGEKLQPVDIENMITAHSAVTGAMVVGEGRFQSCLLVESAPLLQAEMGKNKLIEDLWPLVQKANQKVPTYARIHKHMIMFTSPERPMSRAPKGTIQRKPTENLYASEISALYDALEKTDFKIIDHTMTDLTAHEMTEIIIDSCTDIDRSNLNADANLFEIGLDSLQAIMAEKMLKEGLAARGITMESTIKIFYDNPTFASLTAAVEALLDGGAEGTINQVSIEKQMQAIFEKHAEEIPISLKRYHSPRSDNHTVLLTGSTGSLGSYILDSLCRDTRIKRIYCLNRGPNGKQRQMVSQSLKGLQDLHCRVEFLESKISDPYLGVGLENYQMLLNSVTITIHNAWMVNFSHTVHSFSENITSVNRLIEVSAQSASGASIVFVSSTSSVARIPGRALEKVYDDWSYPQETGYAQSKFIGERLLDKAAREAGVPAVVCRVGQVAGPSTRLGEWPRKEWFPSLIQSAKHIRKVPKSLGALENIDWIPVDIAGRVVVELAMEPLEMSQTQPGAMVYQVVNPRTVSWSQLSANVTRHITDTRNIELVSLFEWVTAVRDTASEMNDMEKNPAVKLLDFFGNIASGSGNGTNFETKRAIEASPSLAQLDVVNDVWLANWIRQWGLMEERV